MNPELTQALNTADSMINPLLTDPNKNQDRINQLKDLRIKMENRIKSFNDTTSRAYQQTVDEINSLLKQIQDLINLINQPPQQ